MLLLNTGKQCRRPQQPLALCVNHYLLRYQENRLIGIDLILRLVMYGGVKFVLPVFAIILLTACEREGGDSVWWGNQKTIIELEQRIELARYRLEMRNPAAATGSLPAKDLSKEIASLTLRQRQVSAEIKNLRDGWVGFRAETLQRRRAAAMAEVTGNFHLPDGRVLQDARITKIDDGGVSVSHETGAARLRIDDLDESQRAFFGLDADLAEIAYSRELDQRNAYERWHDERQNANEEESRKLAEVRREEEIRLKSAKLIAAANRTVVQRPLSSGIGALGETGSVYGTGYSSRRSRYYSRPSIHYYHPPSAVRCATGTPFWGYSSPFRRPCHSYTAPRSVTPFIHSQNE